MDDRGWTQQDPEPAEELSSSAPDRRRLDEGLDLGVRRGSAWLRQHPLLVAAAAVLVVGGLAAGQYLATRPPPVDPVVDITVQSTGGGNHYLLILRSSSEDVRPIGIVGPGLVEPTSTISRVTANGPGIGNLGATLDCTVGAWWTAGPGDYRARVERTDAYGRLTTYDAPIVEPASSWADRVRSECLERAVLNLPPATAAEVSAGSDGRHLEVDVLVANPNPFPIRGSVAEATDEQFGWQQGPPFEVPAGGSAEVTARARIDCGQSAPTLPTLTIGPPGGEFSGPGLTVLVDVGTAAEDLLQIASVVPLDAAAAATVNAAAADLCR